MTAHTVKFRPVIVPPGEVKQLTARMPVAFKGSNLVAHEGRDLLLEQLHVNGRSQLEEMRAEPISLWYFAPETFATTLQLDVCKAGGDITVAVFNPTPLPQRCRIELRGVVK